MDLHGNLTEEPIDDRIRKLSNAGVAISDFASNYIRLRDIYEGEQLKDSHIYNIIVATYRSSLGSIKPAVEQAKVLFLLHYGNLDMFMESDDSLPLEKRIEVLNELNYDYDNPIKFIDWMINNYLDFIDDFVPVANFLKSLKPDIDFSAYGYDASLDRNGVIVDLQKVMSEG